MKRKAKRAAALGVPASTIEAVVPRGGPRRCRRDRAATPGARRTRGGAVETAPARPPTGEALLVLQGVHAGYDDVEVLHGVDLVGLRRAPSPRCSGRTAAARRRCAPRSPGWCRCGVGRSWCTAPTCPGRLPYRRARGGVLVAPESRGIFPGLTVEENLVLRLPGAAGATRSTSGSRCWRERRRLASGSLSGRRAADAGAGPGAGGPAELVVADEPTLGLAPLIVDDVLRRVRGAARSGQRDPARRGEGARRARGRRAAWRSWSSAASRGAVRAPTSTTSASWPPTSARVVAEQSALLRLPLQRGDDHLRLGLHARGVGVVRHRR